MLPATDSSLQLQPPPLAMDPAEFRTAGHCLVEKIAAFLAELPQKPVTTGAQPAQVQSVLGKAPLPEDGTAASVLLEKASRLLFDHSLFNGHPRFWGYITASAAPIGALAELLAATVNANVGAFALAPMATEIEKQTLSWLAELIGYQRACGGLFVSGGNVANFVGYLAARHCKVNIKKEGLDAHLARYGTTRQPWGCYEPPGRQRPKPQRQFTVYCAEGTHTWVQKAASLFGHGTDSIRWVAVKENGQMDLHQLNQRIIADRQGGHFPFLVVGNAGSVGTGVVDALADIARTCRQHHLWFHVDGAYGAPAAALPENAELFAGLSQADSLALDPHKWLYSPLEAGCVLVREPEHLREAFSFHPDYYNFDGDGQERPTNFYDYGLQNSRGFRALKVWLSLQQAGRKGYQSLMRHDIALARHLYQLVREQAELEAISQHLSITTFRYVPAELSADHPAREAYLNELNEILLNRLQRGGEVFLSQAVIGNKYCLRVCLVNFRTQLSDITALPAIVIREGRQLAEQLRVPSAGSDDVETGVRR